MNRKETIIFFVLSALIVVAGLAWQAPDNPLEMMFEKSAIVRAAENYLQAEMQGDPRRIYALLAPSSIYRKTHSYDDYVKDLQNFPPVKIASYRIVGIYRLRQNDDRLTYPGVDKLVQVEVDVTFAHSGSNTMFNYSFTFLKERGAWYKG